MRDNYTALITLLILLISVVFTVPTSLVKVVQAQTITLHLVMDCEDVYGGHDEIVSSIQAELAKIGIEVLIEYRDGATFASTVWSEYWDKTWDEAPGKGWDMAWYSFPRPKSWAVIACTSTGLWSHTADAHYVYHVLTEHYNFDDESIYYMNDKSLLGVDTTWVNKYELRWAINQWLASRSDADDLIFIYIVGHGGGYNTIENDWAGGREDGSAGDPKDEGDEHFIDGEWVGVDECIKLDLDDRKYWDDELKSDLNTLSYSRLIFVGAGGKESEEENGGCYNGGLIDDISAPNRIIMTASNETYYCWRDRDGDGFSEWTESFMDALHGEDTIWYDNEVVHTGVPVNADENSDGRVSMLEAWDYAWDHDDARLEGKETPWLDDNGNGEPTYINGHDVNAPVDDGQLASETYLPALEDLEEDLKNHYLANATPPNGGYNIMCWNNPKADKILKWGMNETDAEWRKTLLWKWQEIYMHDAPCPVLYYLRDNRSRGLAFNLHHPALSNRYVRQAIAHAIPYKTIYTIIQEWGIDPCFLPYAVPLTGGIFPYSYYEEVCLYPSVFELEPYEYNIAKAQQYMNMYTYSTDEVNWALGPVGDADQSGLVDATDWGIWRTSPLTGTWPDPTGWIYPEWPFTIDPDWDNDGDADGVDKSLWGDNYGIEYPFPGASPIAPSASAEYPAIYVEPAAIEDKAYDPGTEFTVSIWTNYTGSDVWGYEFTLYYNPLVLNVTEVTNGDLITKEKDPSATFISGTFNNALGKLSLTGASFYAGTPLPLTSGPGILANVTFTVVGTGDSYILFGDKTRLIGVTEGGWGTEYDIIDALIMPYHIGSGYFCNVKPPPTHDLAITSVTTYPAMVIVGEHVNITVDVKNEGTVTEMFEVKVYFDHIHPNWLIGEETGTLDAKRSVSLTFAWDTTGELRGNHTIIAVASTVIGETDTADNTYVDGTVEVGVRDVVVTNVTASDSRYGTTTVYPSWEVTITVNVKNEGDLSETFNVTAYYDSTAINTQTVNNLAPGANTTLTFIMTGVSPGNAGLNYTISAEASVVPYEIDTDDNTYVDGDIWVRYPGDLDGDGDVDWSDFVLFAAGYLTFPPDPILIPLADLDYDGDVDGDDFILFTGYYGHTP